jgi:hypothetical protein
MEPMVVGIQFPEHQPAQIPGSGEDMGWPGAHSVESGSCPLRCAPRPRIVGTTS